MHDHQNAPNVLVQRHNTSQARIEAGGGGGGLKAKTQDPGEISGETLHNINYIQIKGEVVVGGHAPPSGPRRMKTGQ